MSKTPETDAEVGYFDLETAVSADFARCLERERDEAREELRTAVQERHDFHWELQDAIRERNEAREALRAVLELANDIPDETLDDWKIEFHKVLEAAK
jgi:uncharacterized protein (DUF3084 family)